MMLGHFFVVRRVACGVLFLSSTAIEASSTDANLSFVGGSIDLLLLPELQVKQRPCQYGSGKSWPGYDMVVHEKS